LNDEVLLNYKDVNKNEKKWLKKGEKLEDYKILKIKKDSVLLKHKNKIEILKLHNVNKINLKVFK
jgi:hypothetical protein